MIGGGNRLTGPVGYLHAKGALAPLLAEAGVGDITVFSFPNGPDLNQALVAGELDLATYGVTPALVARGAGRPTRLIAQPPSTSTRTPPRSRRPTPARACPVRGSRGCGGRAARAGPVRTAGRHARRIARGRVTAPPRPGPYTDRYAHSRLIGVSSLP